MKIRHVAVALASFGSALLLVACTSTVGPSQSTPQTLQPVRVTGTITWRERMAVPPDADVVVRLQDVSRMDAPAIVLAEQRFKTEGRQPPYPFELTVDGSRIDARMRYTVAARVERNGVLMFINDTSYAVITQGGGYTANLLLVQVRR